MALSIDQLTALTHRYIQPKLHDNIFDSNPTLKKIMDSGSYESISGGTTIDVPLNYATTSSSGWYQGAQTLSTADNDMITAARYQWCSLYANITITREDELKNSGDAAAVKLLKSKAQIAEKTMKDNLGTGIFSDGTNSLSIVGLRDIVGVAETIGGISQSENSWWQGQVDSSTTTLSLSALNLIFEDCAVDNERPSFVVTTRAIYGYYYDLLTPQQRFTDGSMAKGGFESLMFNGVALFSDSHCPSGHVFMPNLNALKLYYHPEQNMITTEFQKPINQEVKVARVLWMGALGSTNNRYHGKLSAITA